MNRKLVTLGMIGCLATAGAATAWATSTAGSGDTAHSGAATIQAPADPAPAPAGAGDGHGGDDGGGHAAPAPSPRGHGGPHWDYDGGDGPEDWDKVSHDYKVCGEGHEQSPIDLTGGVDAEVANIALHWTPAAWQVVNNGHTLQVEGGNGGYALIDGERFDLLQFHFHTPSEHAIDGRRFPMEAHFVHKAADGRLAVIGVMMMPGGPNPLFSAIMNKAPAEEGGAALGQIDQRGLVSPINGVYRYQGSLTTPPCSETVLWTVLTIPVLVQEADIAAFAKLFPMNARPLQPLHRRYLLRD